MHQSQTQPQQWKPRPVVQDPEFPGLTGKQICQLMRKHNVTIKELSKRMQITMKRVRFVRETGLVFPFSLDWQQMITGAAELTPRERAGFKQWQMNRRWISSFRPLKASPAIDIHSIHHEAVHWTDELAVLYGTHSEGRSFTDRVQNLIKKFPDFL